MVIGVVSDLLFSSRIRAVAQAADAVVTFARGRDAAVAAASHAAARLVVVDLEDRSADPIETIRAIRAAVGADLRIVGYGSHVNVPLLQAAREAGCDDAMPRSAFVAALPALVALSAAKAG